MSLVTGGWLAFGYTASSWIIRLVMAVVVPFRRSPDAARGWLLLFFFLPWPALVLYFLIGRPRYPAWRRERFRHLPELFQITAEQIRRLATATDPPLPPNLAAAATLIQNLGRLPVLDGNTVELMSDYEGMIDALVADIEGAQADVHLLFYIFADDRIGRRVMAALEHAAARGVPCRVLIDALGSRTWAYDVTVRLEAAGIAIHQMLPVGILRRRSARADLRNHRKIAVIDGRIGYVGSQNIVDPEFRPGIHNTELMVRLRGPTVLELQALFMGDWFIETQEVLDREALLRSPESPGTIAAQVLPSGPDFPDAGIENLLLSLIHDARERVIITTPYFVPSVPFIRAMQTAVLRGVRVTLVVSLVTDHELVKLAQRSYYGELMGSGVRIRQHRGNLLHAKTILIDDDIALIGSSNVDIRSFVLNSEVTLVCYDKAVAAGLRAEQERFIAGSALLSPSAWHRRPLVQKVAENFARLLSPLL